jgi:hypothetical protein
LFCVRGCHSCLHHGFRDLGWSFLFFSPSTTLVASSCSSSGCQNQERKNSLSVCKVITFVCRWCSLHTVYTADAASFYCSAGTYVVPPMALRSVSAFSLWSCKTKFRVLCLLNLCACLQSLGVCTQCTFLLLLSCRCV